MAWQKLREVDSNGNPWDRYTGPEGVAGVWLDAARNVAGHINGVPFGPLGRPPEGNVQGLRIAPRDGGWEVVAFVDPRDGRRAEWREQVA